MPLVKVNEAVSAHQPDEVCGRSLRAQQGERVGGVGVGKVLLKAGYNNTFVINEIAAPRHALFHRWQTAIVLQRIARCDQPPNAVQLQPFKCGQRGIDVTLMRGIERAAEQSNPIACVGRWRILWK